MLREDYYIVLGVRHGAREEEIHQAYRNLVRRLHPDLNPGLPGAEERLKRVNEAYRVLHDADTRYHYDRMLFLSGPNLSSVSRTATSRQSIRRHKALVPLAVAVCLALATLFIALNLGEGRPVPIEWQTGSADCSDLTVEQLDANMHYAAIYQQRELMLMPPDTFGGSTPSSAYTALAVPLRNEDFSLTEPYEKTGQSLLFEGFAPPPTDPHSPEQS